MDFQNKWVWITGASSGIGEALAYAFADAGANLVLSSRKESELQRVKEHCNSEVSILIEPLDVLEHDKIPAVAEKVLAETGQIDILVHSAGVSQRALVEDTPLELDKRIMDINFFGTVALTKAVLPHMLEQQSGQIVPISSMVGKVGSPMRSAYAASKHALHGFFDSLRAETVEDGIKVTIVCPGYIRTDISRNALTADGTPQNKMDDKQANGMAPDVFAQKTLRAIHRQKQEFYVGGWEIMGIYIKRFFPKLFAYVLTRIKVT